MWALAISLALADGMLGPCQEQEASGFGLVWFPVVYLKKSTSQVSTGPSVLDPEKNTSGADLNPAVVDRVGN